MSEDAGLVQRESALAVRSGIKLALSMGATITVAIAIRFWLPRQLGPEVFGQLHFAEGLAIMLFIWTGFGINVYIAKEVAVRPEHASDFLAGALLVRLGAFALSTLALMLVLVWMGKGELEWTLCMLFAAWQAVTVTNQTLDALLTSQGTVDELAIVTTAGKLLWGAAIFVGLTLGLDVIFVGWVFLGVELARLVILLPVARRHLEIEFRLSRETWVVLWACLPFFLNTISHQIYTRVDVQMLSVLANDAEVGWYGAASNVAIATLLFLPVMQAVIMPMGARIAAQSHAQLAEVMGKVMRVLLVLGSMISIVIALHAPDVIAFIFGAKYAPSALAIRLLAPIFPLTYIAVISSMQLIQIGRIWTATKISLIVLVLNPGLNFFAITYFGERWGLGGAGAGAALTSLITEVVAVGLQLYALRAAGLNRRLAWTATKIALLCAIIVALHEALGGLGELPVIGGLWRAPLETLAFLGLAVLTGALAPRQILRQVVQALANRGGAGDDAGVEEDG